MIRQGISFIFPMITLDASYPIDGYKTSRFQIGNINPVKN